MQAYNMKLNPTVANDECMARYLTMVGSHLEKKDKWVIRWVPHEESGKADTLAEIATTFPIKNTVMLSIYLKVMLLITPEPVCSTNDVNFGWKHDILRYL